MYLGEDGCSQRFCSSTPVKASKLLQECDARCQFYAECLEVSAIRERPVKVYTKVFGFGAEEQSFVAVVDI